MITKVQKWGNSLAIRIPKEVAKNASLKEGSEVDITSKQQLIVIQPSESRDKILDKNSWKKFILIAPNRKQENISSRIDQILYGKPA